MWCAWLSCWDPLDKPDRGRAGALAEGTDGILPLEPFVEADADRPALVALSRLAIAPTGWCLFSVPDRGRATAPTGCVDALLLSAALVGAVVGREWFMV
jgi:hypothetical protein